MWPGRRSAWAGLLNLDTSVQTVTLTLLTEGPPQVRTVLVGPRNRIGVELGGLFGLVSDTAFGLEVRCTRCAVSLVMWDASFTSPAVSAPLLGCQ